MLKRDLQQRGIQCDHHQQHNNNKDHHAMHIPAPSTSHIPGHYHRTIQSRHLQRRKIQRTTTNIPLHLSIVEFSKEYILVPRATSASIRPSSSARTRQLQQPRTNISIASHIFYRGRRRGNENRPSLHAALRQNQTTSYERKDGYTIIDGRHRRGTPTGATARNKCKYSRLLPCLRYSASQKQQPPRHFCQERGVNSPRTTLLLSAPIIELAPNALPARIHDGKN